MKAGGGGWHDFDHALVGQFGQPLQRRCVVRLTADCGRGDGVERPGKDPQAGEQAAVRRGQHLVTPVQGGPQRLLAARPVTGSAGEHVQP